MTEKILILDFGSQYTQLIARAIREANVYCEIIPYHQSFEWTDDLRGLILSGSPCSVNDSNAPSVPIPAFAQQRPILGICYGAQLTAKEFGGHVAKSNKREYGRAQLNTRTTDPILKAIPAASQVWMSHSDSIQQLPAGFELLADTDSIPVAAFRSGSGADHHPIYGVQFHPESILSPAGPELLVAFLRSCGESPSTRSPALLRPLDRPARAP